MIEIKVPTVGESINEVTLLKWLKNTGDIVSRDEVIAELESEKATFELNADEGGELTQAATEGDVLKIGEVVATINTNISAPVSPTKEPPRPETATAKQESSNAVSSTAAQPTTSTDIK